MSRSLSRRKFILTSLATAAGASGIAIGGTYCGSIWTDPARSRWHFRHR